VHGYVCQYKLKLHLECLSSCNMLMFQYCWNSTYTNVFNLLWEKKTICSVKNTAETVLQNRAEIYPQSLVGARALRHTAGHRHVVHGSGDRTWMVDSRRRAGHVLYVRSSFLTFANCIQTLKYDNFLVNHLFLIPFAPLRSLWRDL
jgi:hypothetical protein